MTSKVGWGILGTGKIARIVAAALAGCAGGELVAVASRDIRRAESFAAEFGVRRCFGDYAGLIGDEAVDLVYVATHHPAHREWAVRAAGANKHVLCEKPMAVRKEDAAQIVAAAQRAGVFLAEAFAYRCHPQTQRLVELLRENAIGKIRMIDAVFGYHAGSAPANYLMLHELAGGSLLDVGCYPTSMAHLIAATATGQPASPALHVSGAACIGPTGVDHSAVATLSFSGGLLARVACSIQADLDNSLRVYGSEGQITVPSPWLPGRIGAPPQIRVERPGSEPAVIDIPLEADVYAIEIDAVNDSVRSGERSLPLMTWDESLANMQTLDRWRTAIGLRYPGEAQGQAGGQA